MAKYIVMVTFLITCLVISNVVMGKICLEIPHCLCSTSAKTGLTNIYCDNVENDIQPIDQLLGNYSHVYSLRIHGKHLTTIPSKMFSNKSIKILEISGSIKAMPDDSLTSIKDLEIANFSDTNFFEIPNGLALSNIRILEIAHSLLLGIDNHLRNLTTATDLLLNSNRINYISTNAFSTTTSLLNLDLSRNLLKFFNDSVFDHIPQLKKLDLSHNFLQTVDGLFKNLNPETLNLHANYINSVSNAFHQGMLNMKWLDLGGNPNLNLSGGDFNNSMKYLSTLKLHNIEFGTLEPTLIHNFAYLQNLFLSNNNLTAFPTDFFAKNIHLKMIDVNKNNLKSVDDLISFDSSKKVQNFLDHESFFRSVLLLNLSENQIEVIKQPDFQNFSSMTFLNLSGNPLSEIEAGSFENQQHLQKLDLSFSKLKTLNGTVKNLSSLTYLKISSCSLGSVYGEFENLKSLKYAYLRNNNIGFIQEAFKNSPNLTNLDLSDNQLTTLTINNFFTEEDKSAHLKKLWLADNPLSCDCRLLWILDWMKKNHSKLEDEPLCMSPSNLKGKSLLKLNQSNLEQWEEDCPETCNCNCIPKMEYVSTLVNCSNRQMSSQPQKFPKNAASIDLSSNKLTSFSNFNALEYSHLQTLKIENNVLEEVNIKMPAVISLYLARNNLKRIPFEEWNQTKFNRITVSSNPWICDCETWQFREWLLNLNKSVQDLDATKCESGEQFINQAIVTLSYADLCPAYVKSTLFIVIAVISVALLLATCVLLYIFRKLLAALLYSCGCSCLKQEERENFSFDAFLLYADEDEEFAVGKIVKGLESDSAFYKIFVPSKQILPSNVNINSSIADCCKVIVVLTSNFLRNSQCLQLLKTSMACSIQNSSQRFIFVAKDSLPPEVKLDLTLSDAIKKNTILKWGEFLFWTQLKYRLPKMIKNVENCDGDIERLIES